ncbi:MAG: tyrosine-protein phosphatase [Gammaproteobacteria bacterium]|nr:tyrosine-protein phosphatase [Gammaproteobacteria bacterium]
MAIRSFSVEHGAAANEYVLHWVTDVPEAPVRLEVSSDPDFTKDVMVIAQDITADSFRWAAPPPPSRRYFSVVPASGDAVWGAVRLLPLEGGRNFRDLGGYATEDGHSVRWGRVFRSGVMTNLTEGDYAYLASLGIATICDYRSEEERHEEPTRWAAGQVDYVTFPDPATPAGSLFLGVLRDPDVTPERVADAMTASYAQLAQDHARAFGTMFDRLAAGEIPLAFNCSAGKDRAGISAALLLTALGVPRATVVADYALSEQLVDYVAEFRGGADDEPAEEGGAYAFLAALPLEILSPLMRSDPRYSWRAYERR